MEQSVSQGKKLRLDICINYLADDSEPTPVKRGEKRDIRSVPNEMLRLELQPPALIY